MDQQQQPLPWSARWRSIWRELSQRRQIAPHRENHLQLALLHVAAWTPTKHAATATSPLAGPARHQGGGGYVFQHVILSRCSYQLLPGLSRGFVASRCPLVVQLKGDAAADFNLPPPLEAQSSTSCIQIYRHRFIFLSYLLGPLRSGAQTDGWSRLCWAVRVLQLRTTFFHSMLVFIETIKKSVCKGTGSPIKTQTRNYLKVCF